MTGRELAAFAGQENVIVIRRPFVDWLGNIARALLFDQLLFEDNKSGDDWFDVTDGEWGERLLLSRREIRDARDYLTGLKFLTTKSKGMPRRTWYSLDADKAAKAFTEFLNTGGASTLDRPNGHSRTAKRPLMTGQMATHSIQGVEGVKTVPNGTAQAANGAAPRAPLATHTNGSTQPEPLASPGLPSVAVNGASPGSAAELDDSPAPAKPKRSARNGKAPQPPEYHALVAALAEVCRLDLATIPPSTWVKLDGSAKSLLGADVTADFVREVGTRWYSSDWRGKQGKKPTLAQLQEEIGDARIRTTRAPGHYPQYGVHDAPARVKMSEVF